MQEYIDKKSIPECILLQLACSAKESKQKKPALKDSLACEISEKLGLNTSKYYDNKRISRAKVIIKNLYFDSEISTFIELHKKPTIIFLSCGINTRYSRLKQELREKAKFFYLDFPEIIKLRKQLIPAKENEFYISTNFKDTKWIKEIKEKLKNEESSVLFILEDFVMYTPENLLKTIFSSLCSEFEFGLIMFDAVNNLLTSKNNEGNIVKYSSDKFVFGLDDDKELENWNNKLKYIETKPFAEFKEFKEADYLISVLMNHVSWFKSAARMLTYEISQK